jgi:ATP-dependent helicase/nuclease subunit A
MRLAEESPEAPARRTAWLDRHADPDTAAALDRGRLVHRLLQSLPDFPRAAREGSGARYLAAVVPAWPDEERAGLLAEVMRVLADPAFAPVFAPGSRSEVDIAGSLPVAGGTAAVSGRVDRLAVTATQVLIVDYKTNRPAPARLEDAPAAYVAQLALYRSVLQRLYPKHALAAAILWTDLPQLVEIPSSTLDAALAKVAANAGIRVEPSI